MIITIIDMAYMNRCHTEYVEVGIGPMIIAGILKRIGCEVHYCDHLIYDYRNISEIAKNIVMKKTDVAIFSTRCDNYILNILLARSIKGINKKIIIVFAGPQATHTAKETLRAFECVDYVIRNEGEETTKALITYLRTGGNVSEIYGLSYRLGKEIYETPDRRMMSKISYSPDYTIIPERHISTMKEQMSAVRIEAGRGCPYQCLFCSTNHMWKQKYRLKPVDDIYCEMQTVYRRWGIKNFVLEHDSLTADRNKFHVFLKRMKELNKENFKWKCSSRIDTIGIDDIPLLRDAGCTDIYFGIESGSKKMQAIYKKNLKFDNLEQLFLELEKNNICFVASFICGHPDETEDDLEKTLRLMVFCKIFFNCTGVQLHRLAPENGSELYESLKDELVFDPFSVSDQATEKLTEFEIDIIRKHPTIFAAYYRPVLSKKMMKRYDRAIKNGITLIQRYPLTLNILIHRFGMSMIHLIAYTEEELNLLVSNCINYCSDTEKHEIERIYQYESLRKGKLLHKDGYFYVDLKALTGQDIEQSIYIKSGNSEEHTTFFGIEANLICKMERGVL